MSRKAQIPIERLSRREREIMNAVFRLGNRATAEEIRRQLADAPGDSAVRVMLGRMEKKGVLRHRPEGPRFVYSATISPAAVRRTALRQLLATFFPGPPHQMASALVAEAYWNDAELAALRAEIDRVRKERGPQ